MKLLYVNRPLGEWPAELDEALAADAAPRPDLLPLYPGADSALTRPGFPTFLPDFARRGWEARLVALCRVARLGKWVEPRFARRYIDAVAIGAAIMPADGAPCPPVWDGALIPGEFLPYDPSVTITAGCRAAITAERSAADTAALCPESSAASLEIPLAGLRVEETLALISRSVTIKSGDIIATAALPAAFPAAIGLDLSVTDTDTGTRLLRARLK